MLAITGNVALVAEPVARAQGQSALAETLFQDAKKLMADGDFTTACPKLAESYRLDAGNGTRLALSLCYEGQGKTASAWALFTEVAAAARLENRSDREVIARAHVATLEPKLSRLVIDVPSSTAHVAGLEVKRDGIVTPEAVWGTAVPVDPGRHVVEASAPGKKRWESIVTVGPKTDKVTSTIPLLEDEALVARPTPAAPTARIPGLSSSGNEVGDEPAAKTGGGSGRAVGFVIGGFGVAALGVGAVFGVRAITKSSDAKSLCSTGPCTNPNAVSTNSDAKTAARVADVAIGAGLVALVVGAYLVLSSPRSAPAQSTKTSSLTPTFDGRGGGLSLQRTW
ncbi:MAG: hypothetical protein QOI41_6345 [Myxococcales bacterium]|nr:hypothetical protein [Myxococcales bacterium]